MRRCLTFPAMAVLACAVFLSASGSASASPAETIRATPMRNAPRAKAPIVQMIPANAEIDLTDCGVAWCYVSWRNVFGYVPASAVVALDEPVPPVIYSAPFYDWGPYYGFGWGGVYGGHGHGRWHGPRYHRQPIYIPHGHGRHP